MTDEDIYAVEFRLTGDMDFADVRGIVRSERVIGFGKTVTDYKDRFYTLQESAESVEEDLDSQFVEYETTDYSREEFDSWYSDLVESESMARKVAAD